MTRLKTTAIPDCPQCGRDILVDSTSVHGVEWVCYDCDQRFNTPARAGGRTADD